jgi:hypothetical protein
MYRVSCINGGRWRIVDASNRLVFVGTQLQGEDWLDRQENLRLRPSVLSGYLLEIVEALVRPLGRLVRTLPARG